MFIEKGQRGVIDGQVDSFLKEINHSESTSFKEVAVQDLRTSSSIPSEYLLDELDVWVENKSFICRDGYEINFRVYKKDKNLKASPLMFFHGGCWVFCSLDSHDAICRKLCDNSGFTIISVEYRLAPEYKFPYGLEDCYDSAKWVSSHRDQLNINEDELILCGDSAGGNLAASVGLLSRTRNDFKVRGQVLIYPITNVSDLGSESYQLFSEGYFLTKETIEVCSDYYVTHSEDKLDESISPLLSNNLKLSPKTLIQTAEFDILRDEAETYAIKLKEAGVEVSCIRYNGLIHAFMALAGGVDFAQEAFLDIVNFLESFESS